MKGTISPAKAQVKGETSATAKPLVSLVLPAYNESAIIEENLAELCAYMQTLEGEYRWELLLVNDGSTDNTYEKAVRFAGDKANVRILNHRHNFRLGQALRYAFNNCRGDYIVTMDLDLSYTPDHIGKMLRKLTETNARVVLASPYMEGGKVSNVPWLRRALSRWANRYLCLTITKDNLLDKISTVTCMVRAYDGKFLARLNLRAMSMDINTEILYKAMILRARIVEIPAHLCWRNSKTEEGRRVSRMKILKSILDSIISGFMFRPFMFFIIPGLCLMLASFYPITWAFIHTFAHYKAIDNAGLSFDYRFSEAIAAAFQQSPHSFIVGGFAIMIAIQLISLGVLALQKKRYFEELFYLGSSKLE